MPRTEGIWGAYSETHGLTSTDPIHQESSHETTRQIKTVDNGTISNILNQCVVGIQLADDGGAEDAKRVRHTANQVREATQMPVRKLTSHSRTRPKRYPTLVASSA